MAEYRSGVLMAMTGEEPINDLRNYVDAEDCVKC
jgi:hypothetical protein